MKKATFIIVLVILAGAVLAYYLRGRSLQSDHGRQESAVVARRTLRATVLATGTVKAQIGAEVKVGTRASGRVKRLYANIGDMVKSGQIIALIEQDDLRAQVDRARADTRAADARAIEARAAAVAQPLQTKAEINQARAALVAAEARWREAEAAARSQPQDTTSHIAQAEAALKSAQATRALVKRGARQEEIAQAEAAVRQAKTKITDCQLKLDRAKHLYDKGFVARQDVDSMQADYDTAVAQCDSAREQLTLTKTRTTPEDLAKAQADTDHAAAVLATARVAAVQDELKRREAESALADVGRFRAALRGAETQAVQDELKRREAAASRAQVQAARATTRVQTAQLGYATITAPISGMIASVSTQEGETVAAGFTAPTFVTIVDLRKLQVDALVDETDIGKVKVGQQATFTVDAYPEREFKGRVSAIYPKAIVQQNVVDYDTVVTIDDPGGLLKPDMTANVTIEIGERRDVLTVPNKAVKREQGARVVYVLENERPVRRQVRTGWKDGAYTQIVTGVKLSERVLVGEPPATAGHQMQNMPPGATGH